MRFVFRLLPRLCLPSSTSALAVVMPSRAVNRSHRPYLTDLWNRKQFVDEPEPSRTAYPDWNRDAELVGFARRLNENIELPELIDFLSDFREIVTEGKDICSEYASAYLRYHFRQLPEEAIKTILDSLMEDNNVSDIASNLGFRDLCNILANPRDNFQFSSSPGELFFAFVSKLGELHGKSHAENFVLDFLLTSLSGQDPLHIWYVNNPMRLLKDYLAARDQPAPEPRLLFSAGSGTATPVYVIGVYVNGILVGKSAGEDVLTAEEMAARDSLRCVFGVSAVQFTFGDKMKAIDLAPYRETNWSIAALGTDVASDTLPSLPEVLKPKELYVKYKRETEARFGFVYRRRLWHKFHRGTRLKKVIRNYLKPHPGNV